MIRRFVMVWLPRFDEKPYSLVAADPVALMVTDVGPFSHLLANRQIGDYVWIRGPYGRGFRPPEEDLRVALVGGKPCNKLGQARRCVDG